MKSLSFKLNGISQREFRGHLNKAVSSNDPQNATLAIAELIKKHNISCLEIDAYIKEYRPLFLAAYTTEIENSIELLNLKGRKRENLLHSFKLKAVHSLDVHPQNFTHELFPIDDNVPPKIWTIAYLIFGTYFQIKNAAPKKKQLLSPNLPNVKGFKLFGSEGCCSFCRRASAKIYGRDNFPELPLHLGCGCWISPIFNWEE